MRLSEYKVVLKIIKWVFGKQDPSWFFEVQKICILYLSIDSYALIRLNPDESEKSISISPTTGSERDLKNAGTQKILEFYYYMGVYGLNKSNQQIVVQINENKELVATINALNQTPNEWTKFSHKIRSDTNKVK